VTLNTIRELADALRPRYRAATRVEKKVILDEFCATTGYHRKAAIRLLNRAPLPARPSKRGRPAVYRGGELLSLLLILWEASGYVCGKYLPAAIPALLERLEHCETLLVDRDMRQKLTTISGATVDRLLQPYRQQRLGQPSFSDRVASDLSHKIATHTFAELRKLTVGHMEMDLVLHCGMTTSQFYLTTLVAVDIVTSWTECVPVWGKGKERVGGAVAKVQRQLPFPLLGIHTDNGGEFINDILYQYAQHQDLAFSHSRPYKKNDQPHVEQRNGSLVRRLIGYGRYNTRAAYNQLQQVYTLACLHANFFRPTAKLVARERRGSKIIKRYDDPQTPYQRLLATDHLTAEQRAQLKTQYEQLNPLRLQRELATAIDTLWKMEAPDPVSERAQRLRQMTNEPAHR
jgi:Integrase core domain